MAEKIGSREILLKGGKPWGFILQGGAENKAALTVAQIEPNGKAERDGSLRIGDQVIKINDVNCLSLSDALQLIDCAFRTLTLLVWRSSAEACASLKDAKDLDSVLQVPTGFVPAIRRKQYPLTVPNRNSLYSPSGNYTRSCESLRYIQNVEEKKDQRNLIHNDNGYSLLSLPNDYHSVIDVSQCLNADDNEQSNSFDVEEKNANMVSRRLERKHSVYKVLESKSGLDFAPVLNRKASSNRREFFESMTPDSGYHDDTVHSTPTTKSSISNSKRSPGDSPAIKYERVGSPPSIPSRNSSLRYSHSSTHEKYPSWPETSPRFTEDRGNQRSSSWAEHMGKPKQSPGSYVHPQNMYHISPQQLHPVHEKAVGGTVKTNLKFCDPTVEHQQKGKRLTEAERLSADAIARFFNGSCFDMDFYCDSRAYKAHSPPERDPPIQHPTVGFVSSDEDVYNKNYENMLRYYSKSPALYGKWLKENYFNPNSSTPLLDRLRMEKDTISGSWPLFEETVIPRDAFTRIEDAPNYSKLRNKESLASVCTSQETLKLRSSYSDMEEPYWSTYYKNLENGAASQTPKNLLPSRSNSSVNITAFSDTASIDTESFEGSKTSRWDISNLLCSSRSNSCWSLVDSKKRSPKDRNQNNINDDDNHKTYVGGFSTSFPGFANGARVRSSSNAPSNDDESSPITCKSRSLSYSTDTLDSEASRSFVGSRRSQRHDQSNVKFRKSYGVTDPELKAIQKQAVLSFYHRQRGLNLTSASSSQESSPLPPPETPPLINRSVDPQSPRSLTYTDTKDDQSSDFADIESEDFKEGASEHSRPSSSFWSNGYGRKAQLKKIYDGTETAVVKVISSDGITLAESIDPIRSPNDFTDEVEKFLEINENSTSLLRVPKCLATVSPDLSLPSPPQLSDDEVHPNDEPLPPPPIEHNPDEALYVNLEELKLKNSPSQLVNSSTQTTMTRHPEKSAKSQAEIDCERLSKDFASHIEDEQLRNILVPTTDHRTMSDYMKGLLDLELEKGGKPVPRIFLPKNDLQNISIQVKEEKMPRSDASLPLTSAYFTTSEPKAKLLTRYCHNIYKKNLLTEGELQEKKEELTSSISKKLEILKVEEIALKEEMRQNDELGNKLASKVKKVAKPNEIEKYRLHVEEMEKIINLLLSLSGGLARAQNALLILPKDAKVEEKCILEAKRDKLSQQHEEARNLKENIDKRSYQVSLFLHNYLTLNEYADYDHFIKMKSKLLMDAREIDEKIKLGEEQLSALQSSIDMGTWNCSPMDLFINNRHKILNA